MRTPRLVPAIALTASVALLVAPAVAAPKPKPKPKPITKSFPITMPVTMAGAAQDPLAATACSGELLPMSFQVEPFKAPAPGTWKVEMTGFVGDWDFVLMDGKGKRLGESDNAAATPTTMSTGTIVEKGTLKIKKAGDYQILFCNFLGGPNGTGKYTFTYA